MSKTGEVSSRKWWSELHFARYIRALADFRIFDGIAHIAHVDSIASIAGLSGTLAWIVGHILIANLIMVYISENSKTVSDRKSFGAERRRTKR